MELQELMILLMASDLNEKNQKLETMSNKHHDELENLEEITIP